MPETLPGWSLSDMHGAASDGSSTSNRRGSARAPFDVLANRFLGGYPYMCRVLDISRGGLRLRRMLEPTTSFRYVGLQFPVPGTSDVISASAEVVFSDDSTGEVGVRFTQISRAHAELLDRMLDRLAAERVEGNA